MNDQYREASAMYESQWESGLLCQQIGRYIERACEREITTEEVGILWTRKKEDKEIGVGHGIRRSRGKLEF